ncbi:unnamed protein product [Urochloa humidicola]
MTRCHRCAPTASSISPWTSGTRVGAERREKERIGSGGVRDKKGGHGGGREDDSNDDDDGASNVRSGASGRRRSSGKGRCYNSGVHGHFSRECPKPRKEEALYGNAEDEPTLL